MRKYIILESSEPIDGCHYELRSCNGIFEIVEVVQKTTEIFSSVKLAEVQKTFNSIVGYTADDACNDPKCGCGV